MQLTREKLRTLKLLPQSPQPFQIKITLSLFTTGPRAYAGILSFAENMLHNGSKFLAKQTYPSVLLSSIAVHGCRIFPIRL